MVPTYSVGAYAGAVVLSRMSTEPGRCPALAPGVHRCGETGPGGVGSHPALRLAAVVSRRKRLPGSACSVALASKGFALHRRSAVLS